MEAQESCEDLLRWLVCGKSATQDGAFSEELPPKAGASRAESRARRKEKEDEAETKS